MVILVTRGYFQAQQLSLSQNNLTVDDVSALFHKLFSKSLDMVSVSDVFTDQWDQYRKVSCQDEDTRSGFTHELGSQEFLL